MGDLDNNQIQLNNNINGALQRQIVANDRNADSHEEAPTKHHLSTYTDEEKRYLIKIDIDERRKGKGFMERMKRQWDTQFPEKTGVSKQNLRDNATRFKNEKRGMVTRENTEKRDDWTLEMRVNLIKIDRDERKKGRGFMRRIKEE